MRITTTLFWLWVLFWHLALQAQFDSIPQQDFIFNNNIQAFVRSDGLLFGDEERGLFFPDYVPFLFLENPVEDLLRIQFQDEEVVEFAKIFDMLGREITTLQNITEFTELSVFSWTQGIYFLMVKPKKVSSPNLF